MRVWRAVLVLVLACTLSGCTDLSLKDLLTPLAPSTPTPTPTQTQPTIAPTESATVAPAPTPDLERERYPYLGTVTDDTCQMADSDLLYELEELAEVPGLVYYAKGSLVKANDQWWTVAVSTRPNPENPDAASADVDKTLWFVTNSPTLPEGHAVSSWALEPAVDDAAADRAIYCLGQLPEPPPDPPEDSPLSYSGRLARGATCTAATPEMLKHLEAVGRVGGAITYPRGQLVKANRKWWTVAVATEVHDNNLGHTRANVPEVVYFATSAPEKGADGVSFALKSVDQDSAAAAARRCLG